MEFSYKDLRNKIILKLKEATEKLREMEYESQNISPREFYYYMTGETPTGDIITILDVLENDFLMIHEVVEISELKKFGISINKQTVMMTFPNPINDAHYTAIKYELGYALSSKNCDWLKIRMKHAKSWLEDEDLPQHLIPRYKAVIEKFSKALESSS
jgi:hypothetical protein